MFPTNASCPRRPSSIELQSQLSAELEEPDMTEIFGEHIGGVIASVNEQDRHLAFANAFPNVVVADIDVLGATFLDRIRGDEDRALVIPSDRHGV